jgi:multidrug efflux system outer membrane protein
MTFSRTRASLTVCLLCLLPACSLAPAAADSDRVRSLPEKADTLPLSGLAEPADSSYASVSWWTVFQDPRLDRLIDSVLVGNQDLTIAEARVREVQELYRIARSAQFPTLQASVDGTRQNTPTNTGATGRFSQTIPNFPDRFDVTSYSASLGFAYELDFWGRARDGRRAGVADFLTSHAELQAARMGVLSETISGYVDLAETTEQLRIARQNAALLNERVEITDDRYQRGLVTSFELYRIRQQWEDAQAVVPQLEALRFQHEGRLAVLLGRYRAGLRSTLEEAISLPASTDPIPAGLPSELLRDRPDVLSAALLMESARLRVGMARAERFPRFSLTAAGGTQSNELTGLLETGQRFGSIAGGLAAPVFNAGALKAASRAALARYEAAVAQYDKAVVTALAEFESALVGFDRERVRYESLASANRQAAASYEAQKDRYVRGIGEYLSLLDAEINLLRTEANLASGRRSLALNRLAVHRALGGAWISDLDG